MTEIVLATRNKKKAIELSRILQGMNIRLRTLDEFPQCPDVPEDGDTFQENAVKKAIAAAMCTGLTAIADDSGLEVDALQGRPGIYSARYAGPQRDDADNVKKLLSDIALVPDESRGARFVCVIALASKGCDVIIFEGFAEGYIGREPRGVSGFGYDPIFYPVGYEKTFAELSPEEKDFLSHRGKALNKLRDYFGLELH